MKKVGIVTDNYKLDKYKKELISQGFPKFETTPFTHQTTTLTIHIEDHQIDQIHRLCKKLELHFKHAN